MYVLISHNLFSRNETSLHLNKEKSMETKNNNEGLQLCSTALIQVCQLMTLWLHPILRCELDTLASTRSIMHFFSVGPFNLHTGPTRCHRHLPFKSVGDIRYPKCSAPSLLLRDTLPPLPPLLHTDKLILF